MRFLLRVFVSFLLAAASVPAAEAEPMRVVCVEAVWCNIAAQIGGTFVQTHALITTPGIDPHELSPTPSMARLISGASIAVINGATYDDWAFPLSSSASTTLSAAHEAGWKAGDNPHLFLDPEAVRRVAHALTDLMIHKDGDHIADFSKNLATFEGHIDTITAQARQLSVQHPDTPIAAAEPVGMPLFEEAGMHVVDPDFAFAVMRHTEPSPRDVAVLEQALEQRKVRMLVLNPSIRSPQIDRLTEQASSAGIPVLQVGETLPPGLSWQGWLSSILNEAGKVLDAPAH